MNETPLELANCMRDLSLKLDSLAAHVAALGPEHRKLCSQDILRGPGELATVAFAPGYRSATLILNLQAGQRLEVCLSVRDSQFLHEELSSMIEVAGSHPLGEDRQALPDAPTTPNRKDQL